MKNILVVIDMQNDFVTGALRNEDAIKIVPNVVERIQQAKAAGDMIIYTKDTHKDDYMTTEEGKNLPIPHCIEGTDGWNIVPEIAALIDDKSVVINKPTFGSTDLGMLIARHCEYGDIGDIEFTGICTDICVISNALLTKAYVPNKPIYVNAACCAGVTPESHNNALNAMAACQIKTK